MPEYIYFIADTHSTEKYLCKKFMDNGLISKYLIFAQPFVCISDLCAAMAHRFAIFINTYKYDLINSKYTFLSDLVAHLAHQGDRGMAKMCCLYAQLNNVALFGRIDKIDLGHVFGNTAFSAQLYNGVYGSFLVYPAQQPAAK